MGFARRGFGPMVMSIATPIVPQETPAEEVVDVPIETKKKKPKKSTLLTPASGRGLSGGDMSIKRKTLLGS